MRPAKFQSLKHGEIVTLRTAIEVRRGFVLPRGSQYRVVLTAAARNGRGILTVRIGVDSWPGGVAVQSRNLR